MYECVCVCARVYTCMHAAIYLCFAVKSDLIYHQQDHWLVQEKTLKISHSLLNQPHSQSIEICIELYLVTSKSNRSASVFTFIYSEKLAYMT